MEILSHTSKRAHDPTCTGTEANLNDQSDSSSHTGCPYHFLNISFHSVNPIVNSSAVTFLSGTGGCGPAFGKHSRFSRPLFPKDFDLLFCLCLVCSALLVPHAEQRIRRIQRNIWR